MLKILNELNLSEVTFPSNTICYVLHVNKPQYAKRKEHIIKTMSAHNIPFEWIYDGNQEDISDKVLKSLFKKPFLESSPEVSCCYKHYLAWKSFLSTDKTYALILEDDVFLAPDFVAMFNRSITELSQYKDTVSIQYSI